MEGEGFTGEVNVRAGVRVGGPVDMEVGAVFGPEAEGATGGAGVRVAIGVGGFVGVKVGAGVGPVAAGTSVTVSEGRLGPFSLRVGRLLEGAGLGAGTLPAECVKDTGMSVGSCGAGGTLVPPGKGGWLVLIGVACVADGTLPEEGLPGGGCIGCKEACEFGGDLQSFEAGGTWGRG